MIVKKNLVTKYSDLDYTGEKFLLFDDEVVFQKLELLLSSIENDWLFCRNFNCDIRKHLMSEMSAYTESLIRIDLMKCIKRNIPEIVVEGVIVVEANYEKGKYDIQINFHYRDFSEVYELKKELYIIQK